jgi:hypothetical protein
MSNSNNIHDELSRSKIRMEFYRGAMTLTPCPLQRSLYENMLFREIVYFSKLACELCRSSEKPSAGEICTVGRGGSKKL